MLGGGRGFGALPTGAAKAGSTWKEGMGICQGKRMKERSSGRMRTLRRLQGDGIQKKKGRCNSIIPKCLVTSLCIHPIFPNTRIPGIFRGGDPRCKRGERRNFASRAKENALGEEVLGMCWEQGDVHGKGVRAVGKRRRRILKAQGGNGVTTCRARVSWIPLHFHRLSSWKRGALGWLWSQENLGSSTFSQAGWTKCRKRGGGKGQTWRSATAPTLNARPWD